MLPAEIPCTTFSQTDQSDGLPSTDDVILGMGLMALPTHNETGQREGATAAEIILEDRW